MGGALSIMLALASSVSWGLSDFLGGLNSRRLALASVLLISNVVGLVVLLPLAILNGGPMLEMPSIGFAIGGGAAGLLGIAALYRGMAVGTVSIVAPISATGAVLPVVFGLVLGERATPNQSVGIALALVGVILASRAANNHAATGRASQSQGVGLALLAAFGFGGFFILQHAAAAYDVLWAAVMVRLTGVSIMAVVALATRPDLAVGWRRLPVLALIGTLDTSANVLYAYASTLGLVSLAAVLASLFPVVTIVLARIVLRERLSTGQSAGVVCALAGVGLIALRLPA